jgi:hypothetical protein
MVNQWTASNAADLRAFLGTETGRMLLDRLKEQLPAVTGDTLEQVAIKGANIGGYQLCLKGIERLCVSPKHASKGREFVDDSED